MSLPVHEWRFEVGAPDHGCRLDGFLRERLNWRSRTRLRAAIDRGRVEIGAFKDPQQAAIGRIRPGLRLRVGQQVIVRLPAPHAEEGAGDRSFEPDQIPVIHEDAQLVAVSKPPLLNVYPTRRHRAGSLIELIHEHQRRAEQPDRGPDSPPPSPCHRLDRETSGLIIFAKGRAARDQLQRQFETRRVQKSYLAVVVGDVAGVEGVIDLPIERDGRSEVEIKARARPGGDGKPAITRWRVRRRLGHRTLVELCPETGRQHQLRVHMAALGHPILGDKLYLGGDELFLRSLEGELSRSDRLELGLDRQALHAWRLRFVHPGSGETLRMEAPLWPDIVALLEGAGAEQRSLPTPPAP